MKVTFKKYPKVGRYRSFQRDHTDIKLGRKKLIGAIQESSVDYTYNISIMIKDDKSACGWNWVFFKIRFNTEEEARAWFIKNYDTISEKFEIHEIID